MKEDTITKRKYPVIDVKRTGQNIKRIMLLKGLTVKDVQKFLELTTPQSIYHWFDGRNLPTIDNLYALSQLLDLPVDAMLIGNRENGNGFQSIMHRRIHVYYEKLCIPKAG